MTEAVITLKERHARKMARMTEALVEIDAALLAYARRHGGRFIRYGFWTEDAVRRPGGPLRFSSIAGARP